MIDYLVRTGGLMRCCLASLDEEMEKATEAPKEGDIASCKYCSGKNQMVFRKGSWEWVGSSSDAN